MSLTHVPSGVGVRASLRGGAAKAAQIQGDLVFYSGGHRGKDDVIWRAYPGRVEDFVALEAGTDTADLAYDLELSDKVAGLRLVDSVLELLDVRGVPRLRVERPTITDASCRVIEARLTVEGCAVDTSEAAPWGRPITPAGSAHCAVRVTWDRGAVQLPAIVDPTWSVSSNMNEARGGHEAVVTAGGALLVAGNSAPIDGSPSRGYAAEIYEPSS